MFWQAIAIDSSAVLYYENLALACKHSDDEAGLLKCYATAKKNIPNNASIFYYSGDALQNAGHYREAIHDYDRAIALSNPEETNLMHFFYFNRGNAYLKLKEFRQAINNYDEALQIFPKHAASYANRGMARYNLQNQSEACADWQKAFEHGYKPAANYQKQYCQ